VVVVVVVLVVVVVVMGLPPELSFRLPTWLRERASGGRVVQFTAPVRACFVFMCMGAAASHRAGQAG
jgi:hypothetical protein